VVNVSGPELIEEASIIVDTRKNLVSQDVSWHKHEAFRTMIAMGATNGTICVWNLKRPGTPERVLKGHTHSVARVTWSSSEPAWLLSASLELSAQVRLWDWRNSARPVLFSCADQVRDVQFDPSRPRQFAAALETGAVELWDTRFTRTHERVFQAHHGPLHCVDWHPTEVGVLCTCSRDRTVKIWASADLRESSAPLPPQTLSQMLATVAETRLSAAVRPLATFQTISSVGLAIWRPGGHVSQLGSCSVAGDARVQVWDARVPHVPVALCSDEAHPANVPASFLWSSDGESVIWCTREGPAAIVRRAVGRGPGSILPHRNMRNVALCWAGATDKLACVHAHVDRQVADAPPAARGFFVALEIGTSPSSSNLHAPASDEGLAAPADAAAPEAVAGAPVADGVSFPRSNSFSSFKNMGSSSFKNSRKLFLAGSPAASEDGGPHLISNEIGGDGNRTFAVCSISSYEWSDMEPSVEPQPSASSLSGCASDSACSGFGAGVHFFTPGLSAPLANTLVGSWLGTQGHAVEVSCPADTASVPPKVGGGRETGPAECRRK